MLACARIGAAHSVVFGGFSADALATRIQDADAKLVITADGGYRRGKPSALKPAVDEALTRPAPTASSTCWSSAAPARTSAWNEGRDVWWHEIVDRQPPSTRREAFDAEHPLFILYTSGTTGKPKGILHTSGGYLTQAAYTHHAVFDLKPETDVYWCTADVGWVTGHSYIVYGPLANGATQVIYEGTPDTPHQGRFWEIVQKYGVTILYTAPDRDPHVHEVGRRHPRQVRPVLAAGARLGRRADQPRGVDLVPQAHRRATDARSSTPGGRPRPARMMISPLPGVTDDQARLGPARRCPASPPPSSTTRPARCPTAAAATWC